MAGISLYNLMMQVQMKTGKGNEQEIIRAIINAYSSIAERSFYMSKKDDNSAFDGNFMQEFTNLPIYTNGKLYKYYTTFPSTYTLLPHAFGIGTVSFTTGSNACELYSANSPFLYVNNFAMYKGLKSESMGGLFVYQPSGTTCYFPNMPATVLATNEPPTIMMELSCALDAISSDAPINISPNMAEQVVNQVIALYMPPTVVTPINQATR